MTRMYSCFKNFRFDIAAAKLGNDAAVVLHIDLIESQHRAHRVEDRVIGTIRCTLIIPCFK